MSRFANRSRETRAAPAARVFGPPLAVVLALAGAAASAEAGLVVTRSERIEGEAEIEESGVRAGGSRLAWDDVLYLLTNEGKRTIGEPHAVRLRNGEVWRVVIESLEAGKLRIASPLFGRKEIASSAAVELDFAPVSPASRAEPLEALEDAGRTAEGGSLAGRDGGELHRREGEPVPGELLAISAEHVAIQSPLGVLRLPRKDAVRYVGSATGRGPVADVPRPAPEARASADEVSLIDGSVIRGRLVPEDGRLVLEHPVLGSLEVAPALVRSIVRHPADVIDLTEVPATAKLFPLVTETVREGRPVVLRSDVFRNRIVGSGEELAWVEALRLAPRTVARFELPEAAVPSGMRLRMLASLSPGARGDARLIARAGERVLLDRRLVVPEAAAASSPSRAGEFIELDLPPGGTLTLEAAFGNLVLFPNTVLLGDPHIVVDRRKADTGAVPGGKPRPADAPADREGRR